MRPIVVFSLFLTLIFSSGVSLAGSDNENLKNQYNSGVPSEKNQPAHLVEAIILFDEIYNIDISEGHYRVSAELMMIWDGNTDQFVSEFGDSVIHGKHLDEFLETTWSPEFFISNAANPRVTHYKTLDVIDGKFELFERFEADLSIDAVMPRYPFGNLDLYMEIAAFSGNINLMRWKPKEILIGHDDAHHVIVKGNWQVHRTGLEETVRSSLNHGGKEKFSYLVSHVNVVHDAMTALQKVILPLSSIIILSLVLNHFLSATALTSGEIRELSSDYGINLSAQITLFLVIPALKFSLASEMPATHYLNLTDGLFILATLVVAFNLLMSVVSLSLAVNGKVQKSHRLENYAEIASPIFTIIAFLLILYQTSGNAGH